MSTYYFNQRQMDCWVAQQEAASAMLAALMAQKPNRVIRPWVLDTKERVALASADKLADEAIALAQRAGIKPKE